MKFAVTTLLAVVGVGVLASASPIPEAAEEFPPAKIRFGYGVQPRSDGLDRPRVITVTTFASSSTDGRVPCAGARARFRQKSLEMSNAIRKTFGMPPINVHEIQTGRGRLPLSSFISPDEGLGMQSHPGNKPIEGSGPIAWFVVPDRLEKYPHHGNEHMDRPRFHAHHHHHGPQFRAHRDESFMMRLHYALMSLGPWEGRAVAFVLGCGIGVLLRMVWVLVVVGYRAINSSIEEEEEAYLRLNSSEMDAEEIFVAPPQYIVDEKSPVVEEARK